MVTRHGPVKSAETVLPVADVGGVFERIVAPDIFPSLSVKHGVPCGIDGEPTVCVQVVLRHFNPNTFFNFPSVLI